jgi:hypothetical protein
LLKNIGQALVRFIFFFPLLGFLMLLVFGASALSGALAGNVPFDNQWFDGIFFGF